MLGHRLAGHVQVLAKFTQSLAIILVQLVEQLSPAAIGQGFENFIHAKRYATKWLRVKERCACLLFLQIEGARSEIDDPVMLVQDFRAEQTGHRRGGFE